MAPWTELRQLIATYLSNEDLRTLCFDLDLDYDSLGGEGKEAKARELIIWSRRNDRVADLIEALVAQRPQVAWKELEADLLADTMGLGGDDTAGMGPDQQAGKQDSFKANVTVGDVGARSQIAIGRDIVQTQSVQSNRLDGLLEAVRQAIESETAGNQQSAALKNYTGLKAEVESSEPDLEKIQSRKDALVKLGGRMAASVERLFSSDVMKEIVARAAQIAASRLTGGL